MRGTAYLPAADGRFPTALLLHGFGGHRLANAFMFVTLGRMLAKRGIAAVAIDFLNSGESDGSYDQTLVSQQIDDAERATRWLQGQVFSDRRRLTIVGHSMGGLVAASVCGRTDAYTAAVLISPTTAENLARYAGHTDDAGSVTVGVLQLHTRFFEDIRRLDPLKACGRHQTPTLIIQGAGDKIVPPEVSRQYADQMTACGSPVDYQRIEGASHAYSELSHREQLLTLTCDYLQRAVGCHKQIGHLRPIQT